jgi:uncharacterized protein YpbB
MSQNLVQELSTETYQFDISSVSGDQPCTLNRSYLSTYEDGNFINVQNTSNQISLSYSQTQCTIYFASAQDLDDIISALQEVKTLYFSTAEKLQNIKAKSDKLDKPDVDLNQDPSMLKQSVVIKKKNNDNLDEYLDFDMSM